MSLSAFKKDAAIATETDSVGGSGPVESGLYNATVSMAYLGESKGGAKNLTLHLSLEGGRELRQTIYFTSGTAKGGKHTYERDGVTHFLPGFNTVDSLCLLTVGSEFGDMDAEDKIVPIYNFDEKKEINTQVPVLTGLLGQPIIAAVLKQVVDKNVQNDQGFYVPSGDTREENEIDKLFRARDKMTTAELLAGSTEASFYNVWDAKNTGNTRMKAKGASAANAANGATPAAAAKPQKSIFA